MFNQLKAGKVIFTPGRTPWYSSTEPEGVVLKTFAKSMSVPSANILFTEAIQNTEYGANPVRKLLLTARPRVLEVTSAFHTPLAVAIFENESCVMISYPVDFKVEIS